MERRKFLIGMGAVAAGGTAALGTGAFTSATATRDLTVNVVNDKNAYLGLIPREYSSLQNGKLAIEFDESGTGGKGVNQGSTYQFRDVFRIRNQGTEDDIAILGQVKNLPSEIELINVFADFDSSTGDVNGERLTTGNFVSDLDNPYGSSYAANPSGSFPSDTYPVVDAGEYITVGMDYIVSDTANIGGSFGADLNLAAVQQP